MSPTVAGVAGQSTKERLVLTAERLFAVRGVDGVSLRQIGGESGMANNSAVQYHFGSKVGLIDAILFNRLNDLTDRRAMLLARVRTLTLRSVVEAQLLPVMEMAEQRDCYYLMFLEQLDRHGSIRYAIDRLTPDHKRSQGSYMKKVSSLLGHVPSRLRSTRINQASALCLHTCADRQRGRHFGLVLESFDLHAGQLLDGVEAFLSAPPSTGTLHALKKSARQPLSMSALP